MLTNSLQGIVLEESFFEGQDNGKQGERIFHLPDLSRFTIFLKLVLLTGFPSTDELGFKKFHESMVL